MSIQRIFPSPLSLSRKPKPPITQNPSRDVIGANFLADIVVTRYYLKKKSEQVRLSYKPETSEIR